MQTCYIAKIRNNTLQANMIDFALEAIVFFLDLIRKD